MDIKIFFGRLLLKAIFFIGNLLLSLIILGFFFCLFDCNSLFSIIVLIAVIVGLWCAVLVTFPKQMDLKSFFTGQKIKAWFFVFFFFLYFVLVTGAGIFIHKSKFGLSSFIRKAGWVVNSINNIPLRHVQNSRHPGKIELLLTYLRFLFKATIFESNKLDAKKERLFNFIVTFPRYSSLRSLFDEIFIDKDYYFETKNERPFIIDCGSNIGMTILFFKKMYPKSKILAFEADPTTFPFLKENIEQNKLSNVSLENKALSDSRGKVSFYSTGPGGVCNSMYENLSQGEELQVESVALSDYITQEVDFLKIDIEGAENLVISDLAKTGKLRLVKKIIVEYHHHIDKNSDSFSHFLSLLEKHNFGYQICANLRPPFDAFQEQFILIYAYRKD